MYKYKYIYTYIYIYKYIIRLLKENKTLLITERN